jgi:branched-chain amino acid aminotransferase
VWEGLRLVGGHLLFVDAHLDRLFQGARAIDLEIGKTHEQLRTILYATCVANGMTDGVHLRLMVTRGLKKTPSQDPRQAVGGPTIVVIAEHKVPPPAIYTTGLSLMTSTMRCTRPDQFDMRLNSHSRLNLILALIQAYKNGADEALMLDDAGHVASCNATNFFFVRRGVVCTSTGRTCFNGITRGHVITLCREAGIPIELGDFSPMDLASADEAFCTGTFAGITPVNAIDGRRFEGTLPGPVTSVLSTLYANLVSQV